MSEPRRGEDTPLLACARRGSPAHRHTFMSWARLLKRVFDIDIEHCPNCGAALKIIAAIEDPPVIVKSSPIWAYPPAPRRVPRRSDSICSKQPESQTGCQRNPSRRERRVGAGGAAGRPAEQNRDFHSFHSTLHD